MKTRLIAIVLVASLIQCCKPRQTGTHWSAGEALKIVDGRYQVVAGPAWSSNARRDAAGYTFYRISVEEASGGSWRTLYEKDVPFSELPGDFSSRHAPEVASFDKASSTVHFDLGAHQLEYKIGEE